MRRSEDGGRAAAVEPRHDEDKPGRPGWFRRLTDVPGIDYAPEIVVDRITLSGHDATPEIRPYRFGDTERESIMWPSYDGAGYGTSASPAQQWRVQARSDESPARMALRGICEALELPGFIEDYHMIIQTGWGSLWAHRRGEPWTFAAIERLCWLDIRLWETHGGIHRLNDSRGEDRLYPASSFYRLEQMYTAEGYLHEAMDVVRRAKGSPQNRRPTDDLEARLASLEAEGGA